MPTYVVWCEQNREGEFEFNGKTQNHICNSLKEARAIVKDRVDPEYNDDPDLEYVIYKITLTKVKA
jgi:maltose-binding protein MalE